MADKEEEYHLGDMTGNPEPTTAPKTPGSFEPADFAGQAVTFIQRNALIGVGILLAVVFIYKFIGLFFSSSKPTQPKLETFATVQPKAKPAPVAVPKVSEVALKPEVTQKLTALESSQQGVRGEIADMNAQLNSLQNTVQDLASQLNNVNNTLQALNQKLDAQSQAMALLEARFTAKPQVSRPVHHRVKKYRAPRVLYYIQAVIPGRAWLISANGEHTLTVREGTRLPGYGVVQLIDPNQGRVLTSSGQTIKFSQQDS